MSCHESVKDKKTTSILKCCRQLVSYYIPKGFVIIENNSYPSRNVPTRANQQINAEDLHLNDYVMARNRAILSTDNTLKNIHLISDLYN